MTLNPFGNRLIFDFSPVKLAIPTRAQSGHLTASASRSNTFIGRLLQLPTASLAGHAIAPRHPQPAIPKPKEAGRNVEVMWLLSRLAPDHKTIADFRKDNGLAPRKVCARFVELCREMGLFATASVAIVAASSKR